MKVVDTYEYVTVLKELVEEGHEVSMLIAGSSMSPFLIHQRDYIYFSQPKRPLKRGDMVFYQRGTGQYVMHRIYKVHPAATPSSEGINTKADGPSEENALYDIVGDNQTVIEPNIRRGQIFAIITSIKRNGKIIKPGDFWWEFFEKIWIRIVPYRRYVSKAYGLVARVKHLLHPSSKSA